MTYEERFKIVRDHLISYTKEKITSRYNYCNEFFMWSYSAIKEEYVRAFKEQFEHYMTKENEALIWFAAYNIGVSVRAYINSHPEYKLEDLVEFVENFVKDQLDDFDNWCDDISQAMYEETSEYAREFGDNPA